MRWTAGVVGVACLLGGERAMAQATGARVSGRITILEKKNKPSRDLGAAVVFLEGTGGAGGAGKTAGVAGAAVPVTLEIAINNKEFTPRVVVVPLGSTIRFPNHDPVDHNVFGSEPTRFDLGQYGRGIAKSWTFMHPGLTRVFCNVHPFMVGFVQVLPTPYYAQPAADGTFAIDAVPPGSYTLHVWHERSPEVTRPVVVAVAGASGIEVQLDARGFHPVAHKNKYGEDYPTDAGERY